MSGDGHDRDAHDRDPHGRDGHGRDARGAIGRRRLLAAGGAGLIVALAGACDHSSPTPGSAATPTLVTPTTLGEAQMADITVLRTASSLEHYVVALYMTILGSGLIQSAIIADTARYFADQHADHAKAFEGLTAAAGGRPFDAPNQIVASQLKARVDALQSESDAMKLMYDAEGIVIATYAAVVGSFNNSHLNAQVSSVAAVEGRHLAVLGSVLSGLVPTWAKVSARGDAPPAPSDFQLIDNAIKPGSGV
jgi:hypothetical protein